MTEQTHIITCETHTHTRAGRHNSLSIAMPICPSVCSVCTVVSSFVSYYFVRRTTACELGYANRVRHNFILFLFSRDLASDRLLPFTTRSHMAFTQSANNTIHFTTCTPSILLSLRRCCCCCCCYCCCCRLCRSHAHEHQSISFHVRISSFTKQKKRREKISFYRHFFFR